jgi:transcription elongation factor Elf1
MATTPPTDRPPEDRRTFDCPWCGAIHVVPADWLDASFTCKECKRSTRLTEQNLSTRAPTELPDSGVPPQPKRVFDCPWCGAISGISSLRLGEHFTCPECKRGTKLTDVNTRHGEVTDAAPDAPHHVTAAERHRWWLGIGVVAVAVVAAAVFVGPGLVGSGDDAPTEVAGDGEPAPEPTPGPTEPEPGETAPAPEPEADPPEPLRAAVAVARTRLAQAEQDVASRRQIVLVWEAAHPEVTAARTMEAPLGAVVAEARRGLAALGDGAEVTPTQARAYNAALKDVLAADPTRVGVAERWHAHLVATALPVDRYPARWRDLNFFAPTVRGGLDAVVAANAATRAQTPTALYESLAAAEGARTEAAADLAAAERALSEAE